MRKVWDIHGGVHPPENKHQSVQTPIQPAGLPDELVYPLSQHIGAPAEPCVAEGDTVLKGQLIARATGFVSAPVHAATSGTVRAIEPRVLPHASGVSAPCIVIEPDGRDAWMEHAGVADYTACEPGELVQYIHDAGIAGMGGAGFPSAVKLSPRPGTDIHTLIINGTECEPYITADDMLMREQADQVVAGVRILKHILEPDTVLIGVEDNKPEAIAALREATRDTAIEVVVFPTKYPSGGEKQLIQILTGREVPSGGLPADIGIVCQNLGTTTAIYRAVVHGEPLIQRITTVTGEAVTQPQNYEVLLGTPMRHLLTLSGLRAEEADRIIMGGPMMGFTMPSADVPVIKTTNCILVPTRRELPVPPPAQACIRCGLCAEACPASLLPQQLYWFARARDHEQLERHHLFDCIECGACSYVCPSHIPLVQYYRASKGEIRQTLQEKQKSDRARARYEARQARIEREAAEKEAKRKARQAAARAPGTDKQASIDAAIERAKAKRDTPSTADPAQAAIERAKAKREGRATPEADPLTAARQAVASAEKRLATARDKLAQAEAESSDKVEAFRTGVEKTEVKLAEAREALAAAEARAKDTESTDTAANAVEEDPVQAIIERAKARRAAQNDTPEDPLARLERTRASLEKRIATTQDKLTKADPDQADALKTALATLRTKLDDTKAELTRHRAGTEKQD